ncbi:hypothetical protein B0H10DRAFT_2236365 [Mycena sp. CBHHK59/15]|nr:hypothetical protein B0H10DRAFT_2236365 [Mycena sp. CBHHK59/15]
MQSGAPSVTLAFLALKTPPVLPCRIISFHRIYALIRAVFIALQNSLPEIRPLVLVETQLLVPTALADLLSTLARQLQQPLAPEDNVHPLPQVLAHLDDLIEHRV